MSPGPIDGWQKWPADVSLSDLRRLLKRNKEIGSRSSGWSRLRDERKLGCSDPEAFTAQKIQPQRKANRRRNEHLSMEQQE